jgi:hypothetical protein
VWGRKSSVTPLSYRFLAIDACVSCRKLSGTMHIEGNRNVCNRRHVYFLCKNGTYTFAVLSCKYLFEAHVDMNSVKELQLRT